MKCSIHHKHINQNLKFTVPIFLFCRFFIEYMNYNDQYQMKPSQFKLMFKSLKRMKYEYPGLIVLEIQHDPYTLRFYF